MSPRLLFCVWRLGIVSMLFIGAWRGRGESTLAAVALAVCGFLLAAESIAIFVGTRHPVIPGRAK